MRRRQERERKKTLRSAVWFRSFGLFRKKCRDSQEASSRVCGFLKGYEELAAADLEASEESFSRALALPDLEKAQIIHLLKIFGLPLVEDTGDCWKRLFASFLESLSDEKNCLLQPEAIEGALLQGYLVDWPEPVLAVAESKMDPAVVTALKASGEALEELFEPIEQKPSEMGSQSLNFLLRGARFPGLPWEATTEPTGWDGEPLSELDQEVEAGLTRAKTGDLSTARELIDAAVAKAAAPEERAKLLLRAGQGLQMMRQVEAAQHYFRGFPGGKP